MPLASDVPAMLKWELSAKRAPEKFSARCAELRAKNHRSVLSSSAPADPDSPPPVRHSADPEWDEFRRSIAASGGPKDHASQIRDLEVFRDGYAFKLERAIERGDEADVKHWNTLLIDTSNAIRQAKLAADKLGIDEGELFPKADLARVIRAFAFWAMRAIDADLADLCPRLTGLAYVEEVRAILEPALLSNRFVKPFARAARVDSESSLAPWMVETLRDAVDDYIEKGSSAFDAATAPAPSGPAVAPTPAAP